MSPTLILTRHAKSSWSDPALDDHERPLNDRGRHSAAAIGHWLAQQGFVPDEVVISGARRTVETWEGIAPHMPKAPELRVVPALYHASADTILAVLRKSQEPVTMLIGHNPGLADFASRIVATPPAHPRFADYPTCATTVIGFDTARWADVGWGGGEVLDFTVPRDLLE